MTPALTTLSEDEELLRNSVRDFARQQLQPKVREMDESAHFDPGLIRNFFGSRLMGIQIPEAIGVVAGTVLGALAFISIGIALGLVIGSVIVVDRLASEDRKTKGTVEMLRRLGATGKTLLIDVQPDEGFTVSARNIAGVRVVQSSRVTARDLMDTNRVVATKDALEKLQYELYYIKNMSLALDIVIMFHTVKTMLSGAEHGRAPADAPVPSVQGVSS